MQRSTQQYWIAAKRVLRYLQFTNTMKIVYDGNCDLILQGASDADWSRDASDRKSATGFYYKLSDSGGAIQNGTAKSKTQSHYQVVRQSTKECVQQFKKRSF